VVSTTRGGRTCQFHIILQIVYSCVCVCVCVIGAWGLCVLPPPVCMSVPLILSRILPMRYYFSILNKFPVHTCFLPPSAQLCNSFIIHHYQHKLQILNVVVLKVMYLVLLEYAIILFASFDYFSVQFHMTSSNIIATISQMK
jgi:hypothetical protein